MKKSFILLSLVAMMGFAQTLLAQSAYQPCNLIAHPLFEPAPLGKTPVVLNRLGTSPQFGEISQHTAKAAYSHLKSVYAKNSARNKREIDNLLQALGYTGINDPNFSPNSITAEILPAGTVGWMGAYAKGHKYAWSVLGRDFETFKIAANGSDCFVYVMKKCGNAFYDPSVRNLPPLPFKPTITCKTATIVISGKNSIKKSEVANSTVTAEVVAVNGTKPALCLGTAQVPVKAAYEMTATGSVDYSKTVEVCDFGQSGNLAVNSPVQLAMNVTDSKMQLGEDGKLTMAVSEEQYNLMKKVYATCASTTSSAVATTVTKTVNESSASADAGAMGGTGSPICTTQTLSFKGQSDAKDGKVQNSSQNVTVIGRYLSTGKLATGEAADKYLCLGSYQVPASMATNFAVSGNSNVAKTVEICDKTGTAPATMDLNVPLKLTYDLSNPTMSVGDGGRVYINLTEAQYKALSKKFGRCCGVEGNTKCM